MNDRSEKRVRLKHLNATNSAVIGETEEAMTWLERAYEDREPFLITAKVDSLLDPLRSGPRFDDLLRRIGFQIVWNRAWQQELDAPWPLQVAPLTQSRA